MASMAVTERTSLTDRDADVAVDVGVRSCRVHRKRSCQLFSLSSICVPTHQIQDIRSVRSSLPSAAPARVRKHRSLWL